MLVTVDVRLIGAVHIYTNVGSLLGCELCKMHVEAAQVKARNLLVKMLGQTVNANLVVLCEKLNLCKSLVGE